MFIIFGTVAYSNGRRGNEIVVNRLPCFQFLLNHRDTWIRITETSLIPATYAGAPSASSTTCAPTFSSFIRESRNFHVFTVRRRFPAVEIESSTTRRRTRKSGRKGKMVPMVVRMEVKINQRERLSCGNSY